jgi:hypothetical protein
MPRAVRDPDLVNPPVFQHLEAHHDTARPSHLPGPGRTREVFSMSFLM